MTSEHIRLTPEEQVYGQGNLLQAQLDLISSNKNLTKYRKLRKDELSLKVQLKVKLSEALQEIEVLDKILPRARMKEQIHNEIAIEKERNVLEDEVDAIQAKLEKLRSGY